MRVSSNQVFDTGTRGVLDGQGGLYKTQNQLSTGRRILSPQDDPVASAQVLLDTQAREVAAQYADNQSNAKAQLGIEEDRLKSIVESVQFIKEQVIAGGNASYSDSQREYIANALKSQFDFLLGVANGIDASGHYLFSGYQGETQPFQLQANGTVNYIGDEGQRLLQVGGSRQIAVSDSGRDVFVNNRTGNGTFATAAIAGNTGTGVVDPGTVVNPLALTGNNYQLQFVAGGNYTVTNTTTATVVGTYPYVAGAAITAVPGTSFSIQGAPAVGDTFTLQPSTNRSVFDTVNDLIGAFRTDISGNPTAAATVRNTINGGMAGLNQVLETVSRVQASIGSRMHELEALSSISADLDIQYQEKISKLQDLDYAEAISRFMSQQMQLEAAQKSFSQVSGLSLFNYI